MITPKPPRLSTILPAELAKNPHWLNFRFLPSKKYTGKFDKLPCDAQGRVISAHDPKNHRAALDAFAAHQANDNVGLAYVFQWGQGYFLLDLDHAIVNGQWTPLAVEMMRRFKGCYMEVSQSGAGLHIIGRVTIALGLLKSVLSTPLGKIELYFGGRFVALTGINAVGSADCDVSAAMSQLVTDYDFRDTSANALPAPDSDEPDPRYTGPDSDAELVEIMRHSVGSGVQAFGDKPKAYQLYVGDAPAITAWRPQAGRPDGCPFDRTVAEAALMYHLAFYTGRHRSRMLRLFMGSALYRPEQHERNGGYLMGYLLTDALTTCMNVYDAPRLRKDQGGNTTGAPKVDSRGIQLPQDFLDFGYLADLEVTEFPEVEWLVDNLVPPGVTLLIGKPKKGKTWMAQDLALAVAMGGNWLGRQCKEKKVFYFALEDNRRRFKKRLGMLRDRAMAVRVNRNFMYATIEDDVKPMDFGFLENLEKLLERVPDLGLIVIDTLSCVRFAPTKGENAYNYDRKSLDPLTKLCAKHPGLSILIVHHMRKTESSDVFDNASGTFGLTGAVDSTFVLGWDKENECEVLTGVGRDIEPFEYAVRFKAPIWEVLGKPEHVNINNTQGKIIEQLKKSALNMSSIADAIGESRQNTHARLKVMVKNGLVSKNGDLYILNARNWEAIINGGEKGSG